MEPTRECPQCHRKTMRFKANLFAGIICTEWECLHCGNTENPRCYWLDGYEKPDVQPECILTPSSGESGYEMIRED